MALTANSRALPCACNTLRHADWIVTGIAIQTAICMAGGLPTSANTPVQTGAVAAITNVSAVDVNAVARTICRAWSSPAAERS